ncbi:FtsX-like permease family protein [Phycicoccus sp. KQZ13P-1]|uniref:ABC transporter permease n=1 Tax=Phycicoccus mangrovi TaxID=2840470 RepID=UPI001C0029FF|nr:FtsX-like permease family protein [Phycicoccus mangrovi]MBT9255289.1 FtsX-like permease family protein [Phycicoccus mangrovi]
MNSSLVLGDRREVGTVGLVAGMCGFYAGALVLGADLLAADARAGGGQGGAVGVILDTVAAVFIIVAVYVAAVVIVNAVETVLAGRLREIAVLRLLGAEARSLRAAVVRGATLVAALGALAGVVTGTAVGDLTRTLLVAGGSLRDADYAWFPTLAVPAAVVTTTAAAAASWVGSRAVLRATPAQALLGASIPPAESRRAGSLRRLTTFGLIGFGALTLVAAAVLGEQGGPGGLLLATLGATTSASGFLLGARMIVPALVTMVARLLGGDPPSVVAARNAVREPSRTTRSVLGLVIGVTLMTTFTAGSSALRAAARSWELTPTQAVQTDEILRNVSVVMTCVVVVSSAIAAVGFASTMSLSVIQRTREIGLLRALGFTADQVRTMITKESIALSATAITFGMALGLVYGALGAQSIVGFQTDGFVWGVPGAVLASIACCGVLLVLVASWVPSSRAVAVAPVEALSADR